MRSANLSNTPSLQHAVTLIRPTVEGTKQEFERLDKAVIDFNYFAFDHLVKPLMEGVFSIEDAERQCAGLKNEKARKPNAELIRAFGVYSKEKAVPWFRQFPRDFYPIAPGIRIPVNPAGFWAEGGKLKVLGVQKWKGKTLDQLQRAILFTILNQRIFVGDDFRNAEFEWVDLRAPRRNAEREVQVLTRANFDVLTDNELKRHMDILLEAFLLFRSERDARRAEERSRRPPPSAPLFDIQPG